MNDILTKATVLVLNRNWQAINIRTPQEAFCQMATNVATALDIEAEFRVPGSEFRASAIRPVFTEETIVTMLQKSVEKLGKS